MSEWVCVCVANSAEKKRIPYGADWVKTENMTNNCYSQRVIKWARRKIQQQKKNVYYVGSLSPQLVCRYDFGVSKAYGNILIYLTNHKTNSHMACVHNATCEFTRGYVHKFLFNVKRMHQIFFLFYSTCFSCRRFHSSMKFDVKLVSFSFTWVCFFFFSAISCFAHIWS